MFKEDEFRLQQVLAQHQVYCLFLCLMAQLFVFNQQNEGWEAECLQVTMTGGEGQGEAKEPW